MKAMIRGAIPSLRRYAKRVKTPLRYAITPLRYECASARLCAIAAVTSHRPLHLLLGLSFGLSLGLSLGFHEV